MNSLLKIARTNPVFRKKLLKHLKKANSLLTGKGKVVQKIPNLSWRLEFSWEYQEHMDAFLIDGVLKILTSDGDEELIFQDVMIKKKSSGQWSVRGGSIGPIVSKIISNLLLDWEIT